MKKLRKELWILYNHFCFIMMTMIIVHEIVVLFVPNTVPWILW